MKHVNAVIVPSSRCAALPSLRRKDGGADIRVALLEAGFQEGDLVSIGMETIPPDEQLEQARNAAKENGEERNRLALEKFHHARTAANDLAEERNRLALENARLAQDYAKLVQEHVGVRDALRVVAEWKLPPTGLKWGDGSPMSYEAAFGSSGARDYMRGIANSALNGQEVVRETLSRPAQQSDAPHIGKRFDSVPR